MIGTGLWSGSAALWGRMALSDRAHWPCLLQKSRLTHASGQLRGNLENTVFEGQI